MLKVAADKICEVCEVVYSTFHNNQRFCNKKCANISYAPKKKLADKRYVAKTKEIKSVYDKERYKINQDKIRARTKQWRLDNPGKRWEADKRRLKNDSQYYLYKRIQTLLKFYLKRNKTDHNRSRTLAMLSFTIKDLDEHLKSTMDPSMKWEDFLAGKLHIDHKKPHSLFNYTNTEDQEFKECWSLNNLQLLWAVDNIKKSNTYIH